MDSPRPRQSDSAADFSSRRQPQNEWREIPRGTNQNDDDLPLRFDSRNGERVWAVEEDFRKAMNRLGCNLDCGLGEHQPNREIGLFTYASSLPIIETVAYRARQRTGEGTAVSGVPQLQSHSSRLLRYSLIGAAAGVCAVVGYRLWNSRPQNSPGTGSHGRSSTEKGEVNEPIDSHDGGEEPRKHTARIQPEADEQDEWDLISPERLPPPVASAWQHVQAVHTELHQQRFSADKEYDSFADSSDGGGSECPSNDPKSNYTTEAFLEMESTEFFKVPEPSSRRGVESTSQTVL
jgi:hypothetical protein